MKFLKTEGDKYLFQIGRREKNLLLDLLKLYPVVPETHGRISQSESIPELEASQKLLEEALADHRREKRQELEAMLQEPKRFEEISSGYRFTLDPYQFEWLLQVLNDIRVGSWLQLGGPDEKQGKQMRLNLRNARFLWAMELSGHFQHTLLAARQEPGP